MYVCLSVCVCVCVYIYIYIYIYIYMRIIYDMFVNCIGLTPGGSSTVHIYTQKIHRTTQLTQTIHRTTHLHTNNTFTHKQYIEQHN
jgi:hypothetical protein